jgi:hypothetical protein
MSLNSIAAVASLTFAVLVVGQQALGVREAFLSRRFPTAQSVTTLIRDTLRTYGIGEHDLPTHDELDFSSLPVRGGAGADLLLDSVKWNHVAHGFDCRVRCGAGECLPFLVQIRADAAKSLRIRERLASFARQNDTQPAAAGTNHAVGNVKKTLVRPGTHARLLLERDHVRIVLPVVCLERGERGRRIRVRTMEGNRIFRATVASAETLTSSF